jgi:hypothetical protein
MMATIAAHYYYYCLRTSIQSVCVICLSIFHVGIDKGCFPSKPKCGGFGVGSLVFIWTENEVPPFFFFFYQHLRCCYFILPRRRHHHHYYYLDLLLLLEEEEERSFVILGFHLGATSRFAG